MTAGALPGVRGRVKDTSFALVANGFADGPAQAMRDYLVKHRAHRLVAVNHPLSREEGSRHVLAEWVDGEQVRNRTLRLPSRPPFSYPLDLLAPPVLPPVDVWFGFNPLNVLHGIAARRIGRARRVVYWGVDFVETRFGHNPLTGVYERVERFACTHADARFELSAAMRDARDQRHGGHGRRLAPATVVPMGAWMELVPKSDVNAIEKRTVVYMGHLLPKQGLLELLDAVQLLRARGVELKLEIIGRGPQEKELRERAHRLGLDDRVTFHGFVEHHRELERMVAAGSIGVAPYATGEASSYTVFADPGKLKIYLAAGLPIVTTDAAPVARELAEAGAAVLVEFTPSAIAAGLERLLDSPDEWRRYRAAALTVAQRYDWELIFSEALSWLGYEST
jgi:glycosyltransferase involved in cell wall biosynthesis